MDQQIDYDFLLPDTSNGLTKQPPFQLIHKFRNLPPRHKTSILPRKALSIGTVFPIAKKFVQYFGTPFRISPLSSFSSPFHKSPCRSAAAAAR
jgi:hypothetical protein